MAHAFTSSSTIHPLPGITVVAVVVVVVIAYRSHLIERTEESFIHLIWPEIFLLYIFLFAFHLSKFSLFDRTIAIVARWEKSVQLFKYSVYRERGMYCPQWLVIIYHGRILLCSRIVAFLMHSVGRARVHPMYTFCPQSTDKPSAFFNLFRPRLAPIENRKTDRQLPSFHESRPTMHTRIHL